MNYQERIYRTKINNKKLKSFHVHVKETDLFVLSEFNSENEHNFISFTVEKVYKYRNIIEHYIHSRKEFLTSLKPIPFDESAHPIIQDMLIASSRAGVGPMAAVAGAIAEYVGTELLTLSHNVIVENGGDIFLRSDDDVYVSVFAGNSPLSYKVSLIARKEKMPLGICTSSGSFGHSLSFGRADAVCVVSESATLADAMATAIGNLVSRPEDISKVLKRGLSMDGVIGLLIILGEKMGIAGDIEVA